MDTLENEEIMYIMCPNCQCLVDAHYARAIGESQLGMMLGYYLECDKCNEAHILNYAGHPPLLDLTSGGGFVMWRMPEA